MGYVMLNLNPYGLNTGDCVIRAITLALNYNWFMVHDELSFLSRKMADMPSSNRVWKQYLKEKGINETVIENDCSNCMTVRQFSEHHPKGVYILSTCSYEVANNLIVTGSHVVTVIDGDYYDSWDSGTDIPLSYFHVRE
ncbi:MAG: hypothetical protein J6U54_22750 [Clostridiales bacterium]|nr:hypothetical protein [Clostridiales bacterium]